MTVEDVCPEIVDVVPAADRLVADLAAHPWGRSSASVYETARLVSLAPWLTGHARRLRYLLDTQRGDGSWGPPHPGYALVPTLSAAEALLSALRGERRTWPDGVGHAEVVKAAGQALHALARLLDGSEPLDLPDMPAIEHITPSLIEAINGHLDELRRPPPAAFVPDWTDGRLSPPPGMDGALLPAVREHLDAGGAVPVKMLHALEIAGPSAYRAQTIRPVPMDAPGQGAGASFATVGASSAATAAWLGTAAPDEPGSGLVSSARRYLEAAVEQHGGPVPVAAPVTNFERGWALGWLVRAGVPLDVPSGLIVQMRESLGEQGAPGGTGLPPDADTSSGVLYALSLLGVPHRPDLLWKYETETHFCSWPGENGRSVTTNAHVLEAFGHYLAATGAAARPGIGERYAATVRKVASWLVGQQLDDGRWQDRWHASPLYATVCCALALDAFGGAESVHAVDRAIQWTIREQRPDGSWGRWDGTAEETAYAVQLLALTGARRGGTTMAHAAARALRRGGAHLRGVAAAMAGDEPGVPVDIDSDKPPLWHDKDVYRPITIVRAAVLGALHLTPGDAHVSLR
ncbi:prenyltransferase/squalene oxidase repeat-containing protein [Actinomadura rubrisoli]|uniref:Squalene cyclase C-terminal domain-containing protein n=1 Tax=Actinomadura rubrisoli TaxID=2530368 RepID=A0A4R5AG40_9ACTN|nr:prenyltransferase/squalene oxidase repeat-containing protein [Actinomadura rubrisoli]TDD70380.1 hypothetical protein E1298_36645 [Actinomadura rubrisoli]